MPKATSILIVFLFFIHVVYGENEPVLLQNEDTVNIVANSFDADTVPVLMPVYDLNKPFKRDWERLGYCTGMYLGASIISFGVLWIAPDNFTNWHKEVMNTESVIERYKYNVKTGPIQDKDGFVLNYVTHPYAGAIYYMTARSCGFNAIESFGYSAFMSTFFWEYGIEAFAEIPSWQDLIITPTFGSALGEGFWYAKKAIISHDSRILNSKFLGGTVLFLIDPFNQILNWCGYREPMLQTAFVPVGYDYKMGRPIWGMHLSMNF